MKEAINAICWYFGITKKEAKKYFNNADVDTINEIVATYHDTAKAAFYND